MNDDLMTTREVAEMVKIGERRLRRWCSKGWVPGAYQVGIGRRATWMIPRESLQAIREELEKRK